MKTCAVLAVAALCLAFTGTTLSSRRELKLLHIIYRHGIRAPEDTYPRDPYINNTFNPTGWGQVTIKGRQSLYEHGRYLRQRYGQFLGTFYSPKQFYVQTTDVDRTKTTAMCINSGLWPPEGEQRWNQINWQPIPMNSQPLNQDSLLLVRRPCPQYHIELDRVMKTYEIQNYLKGNQTLFDTLAYYTGKTIKTFEDVQDVYTTLMAEEEFGLPLPYWTEQLYPEKMYPSTILSFGLNVYTDKMNRLKGGVFIKRLIEDWNSVVDGSIKPSERKAFFYVGHDSTIVNILSALKLWKLQVPNFGSNIFIEFSYDYDTRQYGVELFFRNVLDAFAKPQQLTIPGCDQFCPLQQFIQLTYDIIPQDWDEECKTDDPNFVVPELRGP